VFLAFWAFCKTVSRTEKKMKKRGRSCKTLPRRAHTSEAASSSSNMPTVEVEVPDGVEEGGLIAVSLADGQVVEVAVPPGVASGEVFSVDVLAPRHEQILRAAEEFLWSDELQEEFDDFYEHHRIAFADARGADGEHRLEWSEIHAEFRALYEERLEAFLSAQGFEMGEFTSACEDALNDPNWAHCKNLVEAVLAMGEYEYFINLMTADVQIHEGR
jgi:hypothetical protein